MPLVSAVSVADACRTMLVPTLAPFITATVEPPAPAMEQQKVVVSAPIPTAHVEERATPVMTAPETMSVWHQLVLDVALR